MSSGSGVRGEAEFGGPWQRVRAAMLVGPERPALELGNQQFTYRQLTDSALALAESLERDLPLKGEAAQLCPPHGGVGVLAAVESLTYAAFLAALAAGRPYVPLSARLPPVRVSEVLYLAGVTSLVVPQSRTADAVAVLREAATPLMVLGEPAVCAVLRASGVSSPHRVVEIDVDKPGASSFEGAAIAPEAIAYMLFTSGTTGSAKGVPISYGNLDAYLDSLPALFGLDSSDRCAQANDLGFDLSIHDMLAAWTSGGCLVPVPEQYRAAALPFLRERRLTSWLSAPSVAEFFLAVPRDPDFELPELRRILHVGEPFPATLARQWHRLAPNARIFNGYGPTEATILMSCYEWTPVRDSLSEPPATLPLGEALPGQRFRLLADDPTGGSGEPEQLLLAGSQLFAGYRGGDGVSSGSFLTFADEPNTRWFRTGDYVRRRGDGELEFAGRRDQLVKFRGWRIDLLEIEAAMRALCPNTLVAAVALPVQQLAVERIIGCVAMAGSAESAQELRAALQQVLPSYMVPARIEFVQELPFSNSGKLDRFRLALDVERLLTREGL